MSSRRHTVDERFAQILEEDFGVSARTIMQALGGEPRKQAIKILSWAERTDDPAGALLAWSRKHRRGTHRPSRRRCGQHGERQRPTRRPGDDRSRRSDTTTAPAERRVASDSLRGVVPVTTALAGLGRMRG